MLTWPVGLCDKVAVLSPMHLHSAKAGNGLVPGDVCHLERGVQRVGSCRQVGDVTGGYSSRRQGTLVGTSSLERQTAFGMRSLSSYFLCITWLITVTEQLNTPVRLVLSKKHFSQVAPI